MRVLLDGVIQTILVSAGWTSKTRFVIGAIQIGGEDFARADLLATGGLCRAFGAGFVASDRAELKRLAVFAL
jgi:hypothetical protein